MCRIILTKVNRPLTCTNVRVGGQKSNLSINKIINKDYENN